METETQSYQWNSFHAASLLISHYSAANLQNHSSIQVASCLSALQSVCCTRYYIRVPTSASLELHTHKALAFQCNPPVAMTNVHYFIWRTLFKMISIYIFCFKVSAADDLLLYSDYNSPLCSTKLSRWSKPTTPITILRHTSPHYLYLSSHLWICLIIFIGHSSCCSLFQQLMADTR